MTIKIKDISRSMISLLLFFSNIALADEAMQFYWGYLVLRKGSFKRDCQNSLIQPSGLLALCQHNHQKLSVKIQLAQTVYTVAIGL